MRLRKDGAPGRNCEDELPFNPRSEIRTWGTRLVAFPPFRDKAAEGWGTRRLFFLFLYRPFGIRQDFFGYQLRDYVVVIHFHAVAAFALRHAG
jgi:hypothetical protein